MTRARERLVLSGGINLKAGGSNTYLQKLLESLGHELGALPEGEIKLDHASMTVRRLERVTASAEAPKAEMESPLTRIDPVHFAQVWRERAVRCKNVLATPL